MSQRMEARKPELVLGEDPAEQLMLAREPLQELPILGDGRLKALVLTLGVVEVANNDQAEGHVLTCDQLAEPGLQRLDAR